MPKAPTVTLMTRRARWLVFSVITAILATAGPAAGAPSKTLLCSGVGVSASLAVAGVGTALGAGLTHAASQRRLEDTGGPAQCNASMSCAGEYNHLQRMGASLATISLYSLVGATLTGAGTAFYAWKGAKSPRRPEVSVAITPQGGSVTLKMSW